MITSTANKQVRYLTALLKKSKARKEDGVFVIEGVRMFREIPKERLVSVYVSETFQKNSPEALPADFPYEVLTDSVFSAVSDTQTPQGVLAVVRQAEHTVQSVLDSVPAGQTPFFLVLEDLQDPGNVGTIFRTAEAAGVHGIFMSSRTADIYNPKTTRSTMGTIFRLPFCYVQDLSEVMSELKGRGICTYAAHLQGSRAYDLEDYRTGCAFLIGNEGNGLTDELTSQAEKRIHIPMEGQTESLNAAIAAAVVMFEAKRQRNTVGTAASGAIRGCQR